MLVLRDSVIAERDTFAELMRGSGRFAELQDTVIPRDRG